MPIPPIIVVNFVCYGFLFFDGLPPSESFHIVGDDACGSKLLELVASIKVIELIVASIDVFSFPFP